MDLRTEFSIFVPPYAFCLYLRNFSSLLSEKHIFCIVLNVKLEWFWNPRSPRLTETWRVDRDFYLTNQNESLERRPLRSDMIDGSLSKGLGLNWGWGLEFFWTLGLWLDLPTGSNIKRKFLTQVYLEKNGTSNFRVKKLDLNFRLGKLQSASDTAKVLMNSNQYKWALNMPRNTRTDLNQILIVHESWIIFPIRDTLS